MRMKKILVSACLIGDKCRYDGKSKEDPGILSLLDEYELVPFCPEAEGGLGVPRDPCEIRGGKALTKEGKDCTSFYKKGAEKAFALVKYLGIEVAILKEGSPSCGSKRIHNGYFDGLYVDGMGITASYLKIRGVRIYSEKEIDKFLSDEKKLSPRQEAKHDGESPEKPRQARKEVPGKAKEKQGGNRERRTFSKGMRPSKAKDSRKRASYRRSSSSKAPEGSPRRKARRLK